jgi:hypothetical protein
MFHTNGLGWNFAFSAANVSRTHTHCTYCNLTLRHYIFVKKYFGLRTFVTQRERAAQESHYKVDKKAKLRK